MIQDRGITIGFLLFTMLVLSNGCGGSGPEMARVKGQVLLNGEPVPGGKVMLNPVAVGSTTEAKGRPAMGSVDSNGGFTLTTYESGDGAVVGMHQVDYLSPDNEDLEEENAELAQWFKNKKIFVPADLEFEIVSGSNEIKLELNERSGKTRKR